uniref:Secreted protein n=1 Tax=Mesocestoides corti TaxID=53468 RepID=A0A5K3EY67_MESCO
MPWRCFLPSRLLRVYLPLVGQPLADESLHATVVNRVYSHPLIRSLRLRHRVPLFRSRAPAARILNSPLIHTNIWIILKPRSRC